MFSYAKSVAQSASQCSEATYRQIIADTDHQIAALCKGVQQHKELAAQAEAEGNADKARRLRDEAAMLKKQLPIFCYQATFLFGKRSIKNAQPNGLVMCDFDNLTQDFVLKKMQLESPEVCKHLGIVLAHITPSGHGLRVVFKGDVAKTYEENQRAMAERLGLTLDEACKDLARCSFAVPQSHILYLGSELFTYHQPLNSQRNGNSQSNLQSNDQGVSERAQSSVLPLAGSAGIPVPPASGQVEGSAEQPPIHVAWERTDGELSYKGITYASIISLWWKETGGEPREGERNVKLHRLATNLRYITDNRQDVLLAVMPTYGLSATEMRQLVASACEPRMMWTMPKTLAAVLQKAGVAPASGATSTPGASIREEMMTREENDYWLQRLQEISLPKGLKESVESVANENKINALVAVLPCAYSLATGIAYKIWDGMWYRLSCTSVLIGAAASGKSFCRPVVKAWLSPLKAADLAARKIEDDYKRNREASGQKGMKSTRPQVCIRQLPATASLATLNERSQNAKRTVWNVPHTQEYTQHVHLITVEYEFSTIVKSLKQNFSSYLDFLIKSHQDEEVGVDYRNDASANGIRNIHWNQLYAGNMMDFKRLIPDNSVLNGMPLRLLIGFIPENAYDMNVQTGTLSAFRRGEIVGTAFMLDKLTGNVDVSPLSQRMFAWSKRRADLAKESGDKVADYIRRRCGSTIGMRAGVLSAVIRNAPKWEKLPVVVLNDEKGVLDSDKEYARKLTFTEDDFRLAELVADYAFEQQYKLFKRPIEKAFQESVLPSEGIVFRAEGKRRTELFESLPDTFTAKDVAEHFEITSSSAKSYCSRWRQAGKVRYDKKNKTYQKI